MGVQNLVNHTLLKAEVARKQMREKELRKGQVFAEHAQHTQLVQPLDRSLTHRGCGGRMRLSLKASFTKKAACAQNSYDRLFAKLGNDGELDPAFPDVEDGISNTPLLMNHLSRTIIRSRDSISERGQSLG